MKFSAVVLSVSHNLTRTPFCQRLLRRSAAPASAKRIAKNRPREECGKMHWGNDEEAEQLKLQVEYPTKNPITNKIARM